jgi:hypothetical protein
VASWPGTSDSAVCSDESFSIIALVSIRTLDEAESGVRVPAVLSDDQRDEAIRLFARHGYNGELRVSRVLSEDERVFVLPDGVLGTLNDARGLQLALVGVLRRKVLIVGDSPAWSENTGPFQ